MWLRDFRSPPKALALFQVYQRFAPLTDFRGLTFRMQVDQDVCLQAYLVAGPSQGSFLHVRRGPTILFQPPLMRIEGQLEGMFLNELPILSWIAQGTSYWLRNLGSILVDQPLRVTLLNGLLAMDRAAYPEVASAIAYHPIIPLVDGSWISLDELRTYPQAYQGTVGYERAENGWHEGLPVVEEASARSLATALGFPFTPLAPKNQAPLDASSKWKFQLEFPGGKADLTLLPDPSGVSKWMLGNARESGVLIEPLFRDNSLSFVISIYYPNPAEGVVSSRLRRSVRVAVRSQASEILRSLSKAPDRLCEICSLVALMLDGKQEPPAEIWDLCYDGQHSLADVRSGQAELAPYPIGHPIWRLSPRKPVARKREQVGLYQLMWAQNFQGNRMRVGFRSTRDGVSRVVTRRGTETWMEEMQLWPGWPLSLDIELCVEIDTSLTRLEERLRDSLVKNLETPLQLLLTYPEGMPEFCCLVGIALEAKRTPPGWVWNFCGEAGTPLGQVLNSVVTELDPTHPLRRLQKLLKR